MGKITLVLGGARSGKSSFAQAMAEASAGPVTYIATAQAFDAEMADRIERHKADRGSRWHTIECPVDLPAAISDSQDRQTILVDCLTLWLSNVMLDEYDVSKFTAALIASVQSSLADIILVSNEVGQGIVPENALARRFRDGAGWLNQAVAEASDDVWLVTAGLSQRLKG